MSRALRALVTAGGTREFLDDVRVITNLSRGRFGTAIAQALCERGIQTTLLGSEELVRSLEGQKPPFERLSFVTFADLARTLESFRQNPPDIVLMAAAVSDYTPVREPGKISSRAEEITIRMRKNPKLLSTLREAFGRGCFLVGFKLLSGVSTEELIEVARRQVKGDRLNLTVANDLQQIGEERHPVFLVTPEGGALPLSGSKEEVAQKLVDFVLKRYHVRWSQSEQAPSGLFPPQNDARSASARQRLALLLRLARDGQLFPGTEGNASAREEGLRFWTTPRQVKKADLTEEDLIQVEVDSRARRVRYQGTRKPSIDSSVHGWLYERLPQIEAFLHFHEALVLPDATTSFPYPCGSQEEAEEIYRSLAASAWEGKYGGQGFAVCLIDHGYLVGLEEGGVARLFQEWERVKQAYRQHFAEIGAPESSFPALSPVFASARVVGVLASFSEAGAVSLFLHPEERGRGAGERLISRLIQRGDNVVAHNDCGVLAYYTERGYRVSRQEGPLSLLIPPSRRGDLRRAASVCLYDPVGRKVLLGCRRTEPWKGFWAFPGGNIGPGETPLDAATRELYEETGLHPPLVAPFSQREVFVGTGDVAYAVTNFVFPVLHPGAPKVSDEMEARWVSLEEAFALRPMAAGTRAVLRRLRRLGWPPDAKAARG